MYTQGGWFKTEDGRTQMLRGVNLSGATKLPYSPRMRSDVREDFFKHRDVSFVGRPFPLAEADEHFSRLRSWGFNTLRFLVTWEAIEHQGPGIYDTDYLNYIYEITKLAGEYGLQLFIDPHQDVWSRFSGGDGAPGWTFEAVGLDITAFQDTGAAIVHNTHGSPFPRMIWPTNYSKLAAATMFSLFFGGNIFAPKTMVAQEPVQEYLQRHYLNAIGQLALILKDLPNVIGFDTLNEPSSGYIGWPDLQQHNFLQKQGQCPTPWQSMQLGAGFSQKVEIWTTGLSGIRKQGAELVNPHGRSAWLAGRDCVWRQNGVWDLDASGQPVLCRPHHFASIDCQPVDFGRDCMNPFIRKFAKHIRKLMPRALFFIEHEVMGEPYPWPHEETRDFVYAPHWYDPLTLVLKKYIGCATIDTERMRPILGKTRVQRYFNAQLARLKEQGRTKVGNAPVLIGEIGIPFDLNKGFARGDYRTQIKALDRCMVALEANLLNYTLWNYTPDNCNAWGDGWNGEDLSIFSPDQQQDPQDINSGGRALAAVIRPWPLRVAGTPLAMSFDIAARVFTLRVQGDPGTTLATEVYVPNYHYHDCPDIQVSAGSWNYDAACQLLTWHHPGGEVTLSIKPVK